MIKFVQHLSILGLVVCMACSGSQHTPAQRVRIGIEAAAHGLAAVDTVVAQSIQHDAAQPHTLGAVHERWHGTVLALERTHAALVLAERAVDTYTAAQGSACPAYVAVISVQDSAGELIVMLSAAGLAIPEAFGATLTTLTRAAQSLAPQCTDGGAL